MVMNRERLAKYFPLPELGHTHQCMIGLRTFLSVARAARIHYDTYPTVRYRQHNKNLIGSPISLPERTVQRAGRLFAGRFQENITENIRVLQKARQLLTHENRSILDSFHEAIISNRLLHRLRGIRNSGVYRQNPLQDMTLFLAAALNRL